MLELPKPHTPRKVRVAVLWPDGTAPSRNLLQLFDGNALLQNAGLSLRDTPAAVHNGELEFSGFEEHEYELHVRYWIDDLGGSVPHDRQRIAISEKVKLFPGKGPVAVRLVLTKTLLRDDQHE